MTRITNLSRRPEELLPRDLVVSMIKTMLSDSEIARLNASGIEKFGEAYATMLSEPKTYYHDPERFLEIFGQAYVASADSIEQALKAAYYFIGWSPAARSTVSGKEAPVIKDLSSWDGDELRRELEKHFMFLAGDNSWFVFDRNVLEIE